LDGFGDNMVQYLGAEEFNARDLFACAVLSVRVDRPRRK
jgi:hypothetical protein